MKTSSRILIIPFKIILNILAGLFLLSTIAGFTGVGMLEFQEEKVAEIGINYHNKYKSYFVDTYTYLMQLNALNNPESVSKIETFLLELESFGRYDKLFFIKKDLRFKLIKMYRDTKQVDKSVALAKLMVEEDDRDLDMKMVLAETLSKVPEREVEAVAYYEKLFRQFYSLPRVATAYQGYLRSINRHEQADNVRAEFNYYKSRQPSYTIKLGPKPEDDGPKIFRQKVMINPKLN